MVVRMASCEWQILVLAVCQFCIAKILPLRRSHVTILLLQHYNRLCLVVFRCVTAIAIVDELSWMHGHIFTLLSILLYQLGWFVYTRRFNLYGLIDPDVTADVVAPC